MILSDEQSLLRGCLANPDDDAPWLVYADWLRDHGRWEDADRVLQWGQSFRWQLMRFLPRALPVAERLDE